MSTTTDDTLEITLPLSETTFSDYKEDIKACFDADIATLDVDSNTYVKYTTAGLPDSAKPTVIYDGCTILNVRGVNYVGLPTTVGDGVNLLNDLLIPVAAAYGKNTSAFILTMGNCKCYSLQLDLTNTYDGIGSTGELTYVYDYATMLANLKAEDNSLNFKFDYDINQYKIHTSYGTVLDLNLKEEDDEDTEDVVETELVNVEYLLNENYIYVKLINGSNNICGRTNLTCDDNNIMPGEGNEEQDNTNLATGSGMMLAYNVKFPAIKYKWQSFIVEVEDTDCLIDEMLVSETPDTAGNSTLLNYAVYTGKVQFEYLLTWNPKQNDVIYTSQFAKDVFNKLHEKVNERLSTYNEGHPYFEDGYGIEDKYIDKDVQHNDCRSNSITWTTSKDRYWFTAYLPETLECIVLHNADSIVSNDILTTTGGHKTVNRFYGSAIFYLYNEYPNYYKDTSTLLYVIDNDKVGSGYTTARYALDDEDNSEVEDVTLDAEEDTESTTKHFDINTVKNKGYVFKDYDCWSDVVVLVYPYILKIIDMYGADKIIYTTYVFKEILKVINTCKITAETLETEISKEKIPYKNKSASFTRFADYADGLTSSNGGGTLSLLERHANIGLDECQVYSRYEAPEQFCNLRQYTLGSTTSSLSISIQFDDGHTVTFPSTYGNTTTTLTMRKPGGSCMINLEPIEEGEDEESSTNVTNDDVILDVGDIVVDDVVVDSNDDSTNDVTIDANFAIEICKPVVSTVYGEQNIDCETVELDDEDIVLDDVFAANKEKLEYEYMETIIVNGCTYLRAKITDEEISKHSDDNPLILVSTSQ